MSALTFHAGPRALARIRKYGLRAADIAVVPAAAGGPKGLIFRALDQFLFGSWLPSAPRERLLIGSSIGAWRMAAACQRDPVQAFARLGELYSGQRYASTKPTQRQIDEVVQELLRAFVRGHEDDIVNHPHYRLHLLTVRGRRALEAPAGRRAELRGFALAALRNAVSRERLAHLMERVVIGDARVEAPWLRERFDRFTTHFTPLTAANLAPGLLASGTLPLLMPPVRDLPGAPPGHYWDGGLIDYHLALPYARMERQAPDALVLYPHFSEHVIPGWLDKSMRWRRTARGPNRGWLDNVLIVAPSPSFLGRLPRGKLIDRSDFQFYGLDHDARIRAWGRAMEEGERLRDEFAAFVQNPDVALVRPL
ncbi:patatin-like phospholipase family protein [Massilia forsythiae]|uniref:Patatin-like phospholipase family protein n=1 Tax=Massilia forsythiae TaxID=2728020 RepID=A0A7Z2ZRP5_9BURK|nr:patatin-like phospholipase family protein [Massilia forsythiae]QJD99635.1 patatin-like phospholipase family protein [Massilia forsythiae]